MVIVVVVGARSVGEGAGGEDPRPAEEEEQRGVDWTKAAGVGEKATDDGEEHEL